MARLKARDGRDPRELAAMDINVHLNDKVLKRKYVATVFDVIAPGYNAFTRLFSFGRDGGWKDRLVTEGARRAAKRPIIVDLACGTGDLGTRLARRADARLAVGFDFSSQMLAEANACMRNTDADLMLVACDVLDLCLRENSVDVVSIGYGLRNTVDVRVALRECARVIRPGGILLNLDFYKPVGELWREIFLWYLWNAGRVAGWLWHREPLAYGYLAPSIRRYLTMAEFERELLRIGFEVEWRASRLGGGIGLHVARLVGAHAVCS